MDQIQLSQMPIHRNHPLFCWFRQIQDRLLQIVRIRAEDPRVRRIGHVRVQRGLMSNNKQLKEELERLVPSLVLF